MVDLTWYPSPTKKDPARTRAVEGYCSPRFAADLDILTVGSYRTACGGMDGIPNFQTAFNAITGAIDVHRHYKKAATEQAIIAEGVLASTVWGSWAEYAAMVCDLGFQFAFCYLDTPLEVCLERIAKRQEASGKVRDIKTELVADKVKAIAATREKALQAGALVYDLPWDKAHDVLLDIMSDSTGAREKWRA